MCPRRERKDALILSESARAALEKADKEAHGVFDSDCPGDCRAPDTFHVGTRKGIGRLCRQTFVDPDAQVDFAKLYTVKTAIPAADPLQDRGYRS